jgi:serine/threonine protein kinase
MDSAPENPQCSECGATIPSDSADGYCTRCLLDLALKAGSNDSAPATITTRFDPEPNGALLFGDFLILEEIARGGMGVVYKARQVSLNRIVALKMILAGHFAGAEAVLRFRAEAEAAATLQHPNIVAIHEVGEYDGRQYFSMEYVEGPNLTALVRNGLVPAIQAARYLQTFAEAIHYAHTLQILHRDLKPSNLLIDQRGQPRITDFGLAKRLNADFELTATGQTLGSPAYMSPEQAMGKKGEVGPRSDIYSLGGVLYFLLTGRAPFAAETLQMTLDQVVKNPPVAPRILNPSVPRDLETICLKCLEKEPTRRYASAKELANELGRFLRHEPIQARRSGVVRRSTQWSRRNPVGSVLLLALGIGLFGALFALNMVNNEKTKQAQILEAMDHQQLKAGQLLSMNARMLVEELEKLWMSAEHTHLPISSEQLVMLCEDRPGKHYKGELARYRFGITANERTVADALRFAPLLIHLEQELSRRLERPVRLDLIIYKFKQDRDRALIDGNIDFTRISPLVYLQIKRNQPRLQALAQWDHPPRTGTFFTRAGTGIRTLAELRGRRLAFGDNLEGLTFHSKLKLTEAGLTGHDLGFYAFFDSRDEFVRAIQEVGFDAALARRGWLHSTADVIEAVIEGDFEAGVTTTRAFDRNRHRGLVAISGSEFECSQHIVVGRENLPEILVREFIATIVQIRNEPFLSDLPDRPKGFNPLREDFYTKGFEWLGRIEGLFPPLSSTEEIISPAGEHAGALKERDL